LVANVVVLALDAKCAVDPVQVFEPLLPAVVVPHVKIPDPFVTPGVKVLAPNVVLVTVTVAPVVDVVKPTEAAQMPNALLRFPAWVVVFVLAA
jgi:hypothetical protein